MHGRVGTRFAASAALRRASRLKRSDPRPSHAPGDDPPPRADVVDASTGGDAVDARVGDLLEMVRGVLDHEVAVIRRQTSGGAARRTRTTGPSARRDEMRPDVEVEYCARVQRPGSGRRGPRSSPRRATARSRCANPLPPGHKRYYARFLTLLLHTGPARFLRKFTFLPRAPWRLVAGSSDLEAAKGRRRATCPRVVRAAAELKRDAP